MLKIQTILIALFMSLCMAEAQTILSIEDCRKLALGNNKQLSVLHTRESIAKDVRSIARTMYLPKFDLTGGYLYTSREVSILNSDQKAALSNMGTTLTGAASQSLPNIMTSLVQSGVFTQAQAQGLSQVLSGIAPQMQTALNEVGEKIVDALHTDTRNMWMGSVNLVQPIFTGGRIVTANKIADIKAEMACNETEASIHNTILNTDKAYWLVVSLNHKKKLAQGYCDLLKKLQDDVEKMVQAGVATKSDKLNVDVKENEAEMTLIQVEDGLVLSKMALCHVCGIPIDSEITLKDELNEDIVDNGEILKGDAMTAINNRSEIKILNNLIDVSHQGINMAKADYMPTIALTAGYMVSNPSVLNGFEKKFKGLWNVGVMLNMPLWHWNDTHHKINIAKSSALIANIEKDDATNLITLQVNQNQFKLKEARKKLSMTEKNMESAQENLRSATKGFKEGIFNATTVMEAQTAWLKASTQRIDAQIDVKLALAELKEALGS